MPPPPLKLNYPPSTRPAILLTPTLPLTNSASVVTSIVRLLTIFLIMRSMFIIIPFIIENGLGPPNGISIPPPNPRDSSLCVIIRYGIHESRDPKRHKDHVTRKTNHILFSPRTYPSSVSEFHMWKHWHGGTSRVST